MDAAVVTAKQCEAQSLRRRTDIPAMHVVQDGGAAGYSGAAPVPSQKIGLKRAVAGVAIQVGGTGPAQGWRVQNDLGTGARGDRSPAMATCGVERPFPV